MAFAYIEGEIGIASKNNLQVKSKTRWNTEQKFQDRLFSVTQHENVSDFMNRNYL